MRFKLSSRWAFSAACLTASCWAIRASFRLASCSFFFLSSASFSACSRCFSSASFFCSACCLRLSCPTFSAACCCSFLSRSCLSRSSAISASASVGVTGGGAITAGATGLGVGGVSTNFGAACWGNADHNSACAVTMVSLRFQRTPQVNATISRACASRARITARTNPAVGGGANSRRSVAAFIDQVGAEEWVPRWKLCSCVVLFPSVHNFRARD